MTKNEYISPKMFLTDIVSEGVLCSSVGGNTGYSGDGIIIGGDLWDDDDF